jgi:ankyrin repeat protein
MAPNIHNITPFVVKEITDYLDTKDVLRLSNGAKSLVYVRHWVYIKNVLKDNSNIIHIVAEQGKVDTLRHFEEIERSMKHLEVKWENPRSTCIDPKAADHLKEYGLRDWTPIHVAAYFGNQDVVTLLARKGKGINSEDGTKYKTRTPMFYAALSKEPESMITFMQGLGCDVNQVVTSNGLTLLAYFCLKKNFSAAEALVKAGARTDYKYSGDNKNLIHLCCAYEVIDMAYFRKFRRPAGSKRPSTKQLDMLDRSPASELYIRDNDSDEDSDEDSYENDYHIDVGVDGYGSLRPGIKEAIVENPDIYLDDYVSETDFWKFAGGHPSLPQNQEEYTQSKTADFDADVFDDLLFLLIRKGVNAAAVDATGCSPAHYAVLLRKDEAYWNAMNALQKGGEDFMTENDEAGTAVGNLCETNERKFLEDYDERIHFFLDLPDMNMEWIEPGEFDIDWSQVGRHFQSRGRYDDFEILRSRMSMEEEDDLLDGYDRYWGVGKFADGEDEED